MSSPQWVPHPPTRYLHRAAPTSLGRPAFCKAGLSIQAERAPEPRCPASTRIHSLPPNTCGSPWVSGPSPSALRPPKPPHVFGMQGRSVLRDKSLVAKMSNAKINLSLHIEKALDSSILQALSERSEAQRHLISQSCGGIAAKEALFGGRFCLETARRLRPAPSAVGLVMGKEKNEIHGAGELRFPTKEKTMKTHFCCEVVKEKTPVSAEEPLSASGRSSAFSLASGTGALSAAGSLTLDLQPEAPCPRDPCLAAVWASSAVQSEQPGAGSEGPWEALAAETLALCFLRCRARQLGPPLGDTGHPRTAALHPGPLHLILLSTESWVQVPRPPGSDDRNRLQTSVPEETPTPGEPSLAPDTRPGDAAPITQRTTRFHGSSSEMAQLTKWFPWKPVVPGSAAGFV
ncbi:hypothetical protein MJT46_010463 [Ovis ammon polii x Ovis aries]|nr:hypothetical protein MJT46_010463 [Ovis ammon polii x Ovis aries]